MQKNNQSQYRELQLVNQELAYDLQVMQSDNNQLRNRIDELTRVLGASFQLSPGKSDSRRKSFDDSGRKIAELQRELDEYKLGNIDPTFLPQLQTELNELRAKNRYLEHQLQKLQADNAEADEHRIKLVRCEVDNRSLQTQVDTLKGLLKAKTDEIARLDAGNSVEKFCFSH